MRLPSPRVSRAKWRASTSRPTSRRRKRAAWTRSCTTAWARASRPWRIRASTSPRRTAIAVAPSWAPASAASRASKTKRSPGSAPTTRRRPRRSTSRAPSSTWSPGHLSIRFGLRGPNLGVVSACTTSTHAIGLGMRCIQYGDADIIIAGGAEMRHDADGAGRLRPGQGAVRAQRRSAGRQPPVGQGSRRLRDGRRRRRGHPRRARAREGARRAHLRRDHRLRHERRRVPHHRAAGRRRGRAPRDAERVARCAAESRPTSTT